MKTILTTTLLLLICITMSVADPTQQVSLRNGNMEMNVINYGARIQSLKYAGQDVVLGFDTLQHYSKIKQNFGATVGRYIGRIIGGKLPITTTDSKGRTTTDTLQVQVGGNGDCAHGGTPSFSQRHWTILCSNDSAMTLRYVSPDGENGFPGELTLDVTYTLLHSSLRIDYAATTTKATALNPSNHSFFNLSADLGSTVHDEMLWINSDSIALYNDKKQVTGKMGSVTGTPFDFRQATLIGKRINEDNKQLRVTNGYDHCYQLKNAGSLDVPVAMLTDLTTGIMMRVYTTEPAMQIYTANGHKGNIIGKDGKAYPKQNAICFETMHFPDSPNNPQWPTTQLNPGETFRSTTIYSFAIVGE